MYKKPTAIVLMVLLIIFGMSAVVYAYSMEDYIVIDGQTQAQSNWCWAACASSILDYYSSSVTQTTFVTYVRGSAVNFPATPQEVKDGLAYWGVSSVLSSAYLSFDGIRAEINTYSRPIYSNWKWATSGGHAVLIDGYCIDSGNYVDYMDPQDGNFHYSSYTWVVGGSGYNHTWDQTLKSIHD
jgi:hypothetical protein